MTVEDDGVAGVVAAGVAGGVVKGRGEVIDDLAFPFVAPLGPDHRNRFRSTLVRHFRTPQSHESHLPRSVSRMKHYRRVYAANASNFILRRALVEGKRRLWRTCPTKGPFETQRRAVGRCDKKLARAAYALPKILSARSAATGTRNLSP